MRFLQQNKFLTGLQDKISGMPKYLSWNEMWEKAIPDFKPDVCPEYDRVLTLFTTTDIRGYRQDDKFSNLIDDALHCYYGSHCDYFVTLDKKCFDKAKKVYSLLNLRTGVITPADLLKLKNSKTTHTP
jgi:hypothetical protein